MSVKQKQKHIIHMSDTTTTQAAKEPTPPAVELRAVTRNGISLTPVWDTIGRGVGAGVFYPTVKATPENLSTFIKFVGEKDIINMLNARQNQNSQTVLDVVFNRADKWKEEYRQEEVEETDANGQVVKVKRTVFEKDKEGKETPVVKRAWYELSDLQELMPEILDLLEKGTIRGGVTIKSLKEENDGLMLELHQCVKSAATDPTMLLRATEISAKIQDNESEMKRISEQRKSKLEDAAA